MKSKTKAHKELFTEANPDKGTETVYKTNSDASLGLFTEANPDKGTETEHGYIMQRCIDVIVYRS